MSKDVEVLPDVQTPAELMQLVLDVGKRLAGMNGEWWSREHYRPSNAPPGITIVVNPNAEARWRRRRAAAEYRDALRLQALRMCASDSTLPVPPAATQDAEQDITDALARWCLAAPKPANPPASAPEPSQPPAPGAKVETEAEDAGDVGGPTEDLHDSRVAWWAGKRIYLGNDTQVSRLFWLLAKPVGAAAKLYEVQRAIDGMETTRDMRPDDVRKADQRVWKVVSKLRDALRDAGLDDHVLIVRSGTQAEPEYSMVWRFGK